MLTFEIGRICLVCILGQYCNIHAGSEHQFFKHYSWQKIVQSHVFRKLQVIFLLTFKSANDECSYYYFDVFHIFRNELQKYVDDKDDINHMAAVEVSGGKQRQYTTTKALSSRLNLTQLKTFRSFEQRRPFATYPRIPHMCDEVREKPHILREAFGSLFPN